MPRNKTAIKRNKKHGKRTKKGGSCGCTGNSTLSRIFNGGRGDVSGATTNSLLALDAKHYYPLASNQAYTRTDISSRLLGGKKRRNHTSKNKRRHRKVSGGGYTSDAINSLSIATNATLVGANSFGSSGNMMGYAQYGRYSDINPPPKA
jgi:hypothetical protein